MTDTGTYSFVAWFRQGIAALIDQPDDPAATAKGRATVQAELDLAYVALPGAPAPAVTSVTRQLELVGPGDVGALKADAIVLRVHPPSNSREGSPGELAYIEFYDEDLPWRYTPARASNITVGATKVPRLRPWLALFVFKDGEFTVTKRPALLPVLTVNASAPLPPPEDHWAWAHAQLAGHVSDPAAAGAQARHDPDASLSRLMSPRHLRADTSYTAFVVPAFETGRLAGLQLPYDEVASQLPSWGHPPDHPGWPIYYSWTFTTSQDGSFEYFCRQLTAKPVGPDFGKRAVDVSAVGFGMDEVTIVGPVEVEGALQPPNPDRRPYPDTPGSAFTSKLEGLVDSGIGRVQPGADLEADPGIVPTAYGRWHAGVEQLGDVTDDSEAGWVREVNLDIRERAAAGLGAQMIRIRQDELVTRAWQQLSAIRDANQRLREAELAVAASEAMFGKHLADSNDDRMMLMTAAAHHGLPATTGGESVRGVVTGSALPTATQDPTFRTATRPGRALIRASTGQTGIGGFQNGNLLAHLNTGELSAAPPVPAPAITVPMTDVAAVATTAKQTMAAQLLEPKRIFWTLVVDDAQSWPRVNDSTTIPSAATLKSNLSNSLATWRNSNPTHADLADRVKGLTDAITQVQGDGAGSATVFVGANAFKAEFGDRIASKGGLGVTIASQTPPKNGLVSRMADDDVAATFSTDVGGVKADLAQRLAAVPPLPTAIPDLPGLATGVRGQLQPSATVSDRVLAAVPGLANVLDRQAQQRARRLQPVMDYPRFDDPMVDALEAIDRNYVLPNIADLPADSMTLMHPNQRFIEAFFAGLNTEMARELLWREYPTDQRGSYMRTFWERRDALADPAGVDVKELTGWVNALGQNAPSAGSPPLVLVIRSELLRKFPSTVVYAQRGVRNGKRTLDLMAPPVYPSFHTDVEPDVSLFGFSLPEADARGNATDPGYYFVLQERPGQPRFGLDISKPSAGYNTWDDLWWGKLTQADDYIEVSANEVAAPTDPEEATWGATSADLASILFRSPVMYARHAQDMLP